MARTTQPTIAQAIGNYRRAARLSYYALAVELVPLLPARFRPSPEKLRRMEAGLVDENEMDPIVLAALAWAAGVKGRNYDGISTHALRHTAASDVYASSRDVLAVRDLLGHVSLANTELYLRGLDMDRLRRAAEGRHYG